MATSTAIKFFKGNYGSTLASTKSTENEGGIVFDNTSHQIFVGGVAYGGAITDATFVNNRLTITKVGTDPIVLDFSDTASADAVYHVFTHMNNLIGTATEADTLTDEYANTHYLTSAGNLIAADKALDTAIYNLGTRIDNLSTSNVETVTKTVNASTGETTLTFKGVSETGGVVEVGTRTDNIVLKKVATTGKAEDVAIDDTNNKFEATNVEDALEELKDAITGANITIDGHKGLITSDTNTMVPVAADGGKIGVKTDNVYIGSGSNGVTLLHVDTNASSTVGTDLATVNTVTAHISTAIDALVVTGYEQGSVSGSEIKIYGIKEEDGKISHDASKDTTIVLGSNYNASSNKVALLSNITDAINALDTQADVQAVNYTAAGENGAKLIFKGVSETDGVIAQGSGTTELQFAKVATTGKAEDITFINGDYIGSNLEQAVNDMDTRIENLEALPKYDVQVVSELPANPGENNMHIIYLMAEAGQASNDNYGEYIVVRSSSQGSYTYSYEKLGTTKADLQGYVKSIVVNGKTYEVPSNGTQITLTDVITSITDGDVAITTDTKYTDDYIDTEVTVISTKDTTAGTNIAQVTSTAKVKVQEMSTADNSSTNTMGLAEASDVKAYVGTQINNLHVNSTTVGTNVKVTYSETNGIVTINTTEEYATIGSDLSVTNGSKLVTGNDITKVKEYISTQVSDAVKALDVADTTVSKTNISFHYREDDGKISIGTLDEKYATVAQTVDATTTAPNLTVSGETTGLVKGTDIETVKTYVDNKVDYAINQLDSIGTSAATGAVAQVVVEEADGKIGTVTVTNISAGVTGNDTTLSATTNTGAVTGADIAKIKAYIDGQIGTAAAVTDIISTITVNDTNRTNIATIGTTNITAAVALVWEEYQ